MSRTLYFDLETKYSAEEVGGWANVMDMGMSVGVIWDTRSAADHVYLEHQVPALVEHLRQGELIVGFNHVEFDLRVVAGSRPTPAERQRLYLDLLTLNHFDMLTEIKKVVGHRVRLDSLARPTLKVGKSADGLQALSWYKEGRIDLIIAYCKQDVEVTRRLFEHALAHNQLVMDGRSGLKTVALDWAAHLSKLTPAPREQMSLFD
ncbi:MAG: ribonuclease H-like domain-containing protein [Candidatus Lambdaproteobacteria bacterium]|nr:ribonuclease H-like domain-containing protein [Candidatus Lambdaproteobacteria bacterium]